MPELLLPRLKREIEARLVELRPIVEEFEQLEAARRALLEEAAAMTRQRPAVRPSRILPRVEAPSAAFAAERPRRANGGEPAPAEPSGDAHGTAIVTVVDERPGVSIAEIVAVTKLDKSLVAATVAQLKRDGVLADEAGGVKLASRRPVSLSAAG